MPGVFLQAFFLKLVLKKYKKYLVITPKYDKIYFDRDKVKRMYRRVSLAGFIVLGFAGTAMAVSEYDVSAGKYLPAGATDVADCLSGYYCPGLANPVSYDELYNQGLFPCPSGYGYSDVGAADETQCYKECDSSGFLHAQTMFGRDYYGFGEDACEPASCDSGWHTTTHEDAVIVQNAIGTANAENMARIDGSGVFSQQNFSGSDHNQAFYGITANNTWAVYYGSAYGMLTGQTRCSTQGGVGVWDGVNSVSGITTNTTSGLGADNGTNCYCRLSGYVSDGGVLQPLSSPWVFASSHSSAEDCSDYCSYRCANDMSDDSSPASQLFRSALIQNSFIPSVCEANTIMINWNGTTTEEIDANQAARVTYGGDIRTPRSVTPVSGKRFKGWRFIPTSNDSPSKK